MSKQSPPSNDDVKPAALKNMQTSVKVHVGESVFETSKEELLSQDDGSYFHARFSGRWNSEENVVTIRERSGRMFSHVLYYLQYGDIPREFHTGFSLLDKERLQLLKLEAEFFVLPKLVSLCADPSPPPVYIVSEYSSEPGFDDGIDYTNNEIHRFTTFEQARSFLDHVMRERMKKKGYSKILVLGRDDLNIVRDEKYVLVSDQSTDQQTGIVLRNAQFKDKGQCFHSLTLDVWHQDKELEFSEYGQTFTIAPCQPRPSPEQDGSPPPKKEAPKRKVDEL